MQLTTMQGARFSPIFADAVAEWRRLALAEGIPFVITQGGHNAGGVAASAGTHDGDAIDLSIRGLTQQQTARLIELGRMVGIAAWLRTKKALWGTPAHGFSVAHIHAVPNGWGYPSAGAEVQAAAYRNGRDGLAGNRVDAGPGHVATYRTRTWAGYLAATGATELERFLNNMDEKQLRAIIADEFDKALWRPLIPGGKGIEASSIRNNIRNIGALLEYPRVVAVVVEGVRQALWQALIPGADGVEGSSIRNNILHILKRTEKIK